MTHDTGLVEAVARVLDPEAWGFWDKMQLERDRCDETLLQARAALDTINAAGYVVLAPEEIQSAIREIFGTLCDEDLDIAPKEQP